jgi:hypothetical protein
MKGAIVFRTMIIGFLAVMVIAGSVAAQGTFGLGVIVGEPTGVSGKLWLTERTAIDGAAAWSFSGDSALHLHADYLFHNFDLIDVEKGQFPVYFGVGGRVKFESESKIGIRIPVGIAYLMEDAPIDFFFELVPLLDLIPDTDFAFNAAIGVRYFFGGAGSE